MLKSLSQISDLTPYEQAKIQALVSTKQLKVSDYWFFAGKKSEKVAYISKGYLRKYFIVDGNEKPTSFTSKALLQATYLPLFQTNQNSQHC